jgi:RNA polymerase sigma-70 factor (ECF subfamily)
MGGPSLSTCWTVIRAAASGEAREREDFARRYAEPLRAYLQSRWREGPRAQEVEDAVQEVFVECFREAGALSKADEAHAGGFRAFLYGVARNVARRFEERAAARDARAAGSSAALDARPAEDPSLSRAFDRAWAQAVLREAVALHESRARDAGAGAVRRVELLRRRFRDEVPIRDLAGEWGIDAEALHHEYARARREFLAALREVVAFHHPGDTPGAIARHCQELVALVNA